MQKVNTTNTQKVHVTENGIGTVFDFETKFDYLSSTKNSSFYSLDSSL